MSLKQIGGKLMYGGPDAVLWKISDFFSLLDKNEVYLISPSFRHGNETWCIELHLINFAERTSNGKNFVCLSASPKCNSYAQHFVYKCGLRKDSGGLYCSKDFREFYAGTAYLLPVSEFFYKIAEIAPRGIVTFVVEFRLDNDWFKSAEHVTRLSARNTQLQPVSNNSNYAQEGNRFKCLDILSQNLTDMYLKGQHCDMTFQIGEQEFNAHTLILSSRSPIFASMFEVKAEGGKVNVDDCEPDIFKKFLLYLYSGKADSLSASDAVGLYILADRYKVDGLKPVCIDRMKKTLTIDNFCEVIGLAAKHHESALLNYLKKYFVKNAKFILPTQQWSSFLKEDTELVNQLFLSIVSNGP